LQHAQGVHLQVLGLFVSVEEEETQKHFQNDEMKKVYVITKYDLSLREDDDHDASHNLFGN
jgi:hypothetical protein